MIDGPTCSICTTEFESERGVSIHKSKVHVQDDSQPKDAWRDEERLKELYVEEHMSAEGVAKELDCGASTVRKWLHRFEIDVRCAHPTIHPELSDRGSLKEKYHEKSMSISEISDEVDCAPSAVYNWLCRHGIEIRDQSEASLNGTDHPQAIEELRDGELLRRLYSDKGLTAKEISEKLDCGYKSVRTWMKRHGIEIEWWSPEGEDHPMYGCSGPQSPRWKGGKEPYGSGWNNSKKEAVRERDGKRCQDSKCDMTQKEHLEKFGQKLHVHHIIPAREFESPRERNATENLITLCRVCHLSKWEKMAPLRPQLSD